MIAPDLETLRLFLHVLAATIWVGGQFTLAALVPPLRRSYPEATKVAANAFNRIAWPAFGVLVVTGIWNIVEESDGADDAWRTTLNLKMAVVLISGVSAFLHTRAKSRGQLAVFGALTGLSALAALLLGLLLAE